MAGGPGRAADGVPVMVGTNKLFRSTQPKVTAIRGTFAPATGEAGILSDDTVLLLVKGARQSKAYPLRWLDRDELVLDELDGKAILITYCGLTYSPVVYESKDSIAVESIEDSGYIHECNLVLRDRVTGSLWQQINGNCLSGPSAGKRLTTHPSCLAVLRAVKRELPETLIMLEPAQGLKKSRPDMLPSGLPARLNPDPSFPISSFEPKLPTKERVLGFTVNNVAIVVPMQSPPGRKDYTLGQVRFRTVPRLDICTIEVWSPERGWEPVPAQPCFWFAWYVMYPDSLVAHSEALSKGIL